MTKNKVRKAKSLPIIKSSLLIGETSVKALSSSPLFWLRLTKSETAGTMRKEVIKVPTKPKQVSFQTAVKILL